MTEPADRPYLWTANGRVLHAGSASGVALVLDEPLSFWGGLDPQTGVVIDRRHPQVGASVVGRILVMSAGRGSSSSSTVLAEAIRAGTSPAAIVLLEPDEIVVLGALVARILDGRAMPVVQLEAGEFGELATRDRVEVTEAGLVSVVRSAN